MLVEEKKNYKKFSVCYYCLLLLPPLTLFLSLLPPCGLSLLSVRSRCISMNNKRNSRMLSFELDTQKARFHCVHAIARCTVYICTTLYTTLLSLCTNAEYSRCVFVRFVYVLFGAHVFILTMPAHTHMHTNSLRCRRRRQTHTHTHGRPYTLCKSTGLHEHTVAAGPHVLVGRIKFLEHHFYVSRLLVLGAVEFCMESV